MGGLGVWLGFVLAQRSRSGNLIASQSKAKATNKEKILEFLGENEKITNNNVEKLTDMSNATAERYLNDLEKEGKITQHGKIGQGVFYTLK